MKKLATALMVLVTCSLTSLNLYADNDEWEVPDDYEFKKESDYKKYEADVLKCVEWLEQTPLNKKMEKRKSANKFLLTWIEGAPNVTIGLHPYVMDISKTNPDMLMLFMGGWTRFALKNPDIKGDQLKANMAGLTCVLDYYKKGNACKKDKKIDKLQEKRDKGELEKWLRKEIKYKDDE